MKKRFICLLMVVILAVSLAVPAYAYSDEDVRTADALNELELFLGTGKGYELDKGLTRAQGVVLLVRMLGMEDTAENGTYKNGFTDVPAWAKNCVGYAYEKGITNGTSDTTFSPDETVTDYMFLTLVLRALNYTDKGEDFQFVWSTPHALACEIGLIDEAKADADFTRADAIKVFWNALDSKLNGENTTLADRLISQNVFTAAELAEARQIQKFGRSENVGIPIIPDVPVVPEQPTVPDVPETPDVPDNPDTPDVPDYPDPDDPGDGDLGDEELPIG